MKTHCTVIILIIVLALFVIYVVPKIASSDKERMSREKISIEKVIDMDKEQMSELPAQCGIDIIYDLCQEVKRLRNK